MHDNYPEKPKRGKQKNQPVQPMRTQMRYFTAGLLTAALIAGMVFVLVMSDTRSDGVRITRPTTVPTERPLSEPQALPPLERGAYYAEQGQFAAAASAYTLALEDVENTAEALHGRAAAYMMLDDPAAIADYQRLAALDASDGLAWYGLARAEYASYMRTGDSKALERAIAAVREAVALRPNDDDTQALLALLLAQTASAASSE